MTDKKAQPEKSICTCNDTAETLASVGDVIDKFLHRVLDVEECAKSFIDDARKNYNENADRLRLEASKCIDIIRNEEDSDQKLYGIRQLRRCEREIDRHNNSSPVTTLEKSLFISLFASFDSFIGDLISVLYQTKAELYKNISKEIPLSEVLTFSSIDELRQHMLCEEIESLRRKSYYDQFKDLENRFSITLTQFENWPSFIECSQRRNLYTHCDGIVSKQYLTICNKVGYAFQEEPKIGDELKIGGKYFFQACHIISVVAVMLGQTLWRKILPAKIEQADTHLSRVIFDFLHMEQWQRSISISKFVLGLPKISTDEMERIFHVNYAIALKAIGKSKAAINVLDRKDWSATSNDFKLAYAVLNEEYKKAKSIMEKIGGQGDLISEIAYHDWPLFRDFRYQQEFFDGYESVYGYKYCVKLSSIVEEKKAEVESTENDDEQ